MADGFFTLRNVVLFVVAVLLIFVLLLAINFFRDDDARGVVVNDSVNSSSAPSSGGGDTGGDGGFWDKKFLLFGFGLVVLNFVAWWWFYFRKHEDGRGGGVGETSVGDAFDAVRYRLVKRWNDRGVDMKGFFVEDHGVELVNNDLKLPTDSFFYSSRGVTVVCAEGWAKNVGNFVVNFKLSDSADVIRSGKFTFMSGMSLSHWMEWYELVRKHPLVSSSDKAHQLLETLAKRDPDSVSGRFSQQLIGDLLDKSGSDNLSHEYWEGGGSREDAKGVRDEDVGVERRGGKGEK